MAEPYGKPTVLSVPEANGAIGAPIPPRAFANGPMPPAPVPAIHPSPMQPNVYPPMYIPAAQAWQGQSMQPAAGGIPQQQMQFRGMPPPPLAPSLNNSPLPPASMGGNVWPPPPLPQHFNDGHHAMPHMSMQPPPPPPAPG
ncbi:uncharacterized protein [Solanum lycopersicum]|uniref:uncharacterized protein n=1 Tax=Solanum lycopersicum TaxID=4081 RepID=UPI000276A9AA|nr:formin-like protein 5 [Solanum lycopersicum]